MVKVHAVEFTETHRGSLENDGVVVPNIEFVFLLGICLFDEMLGCHFLFKELT